MVFHSFIVGGLGPRFAWLSRYGWAGVDIFFDLSGFLIGCQVAGPLQCVERLSSAGSHARRVWRMLSAVTVVLAHCERFPLLREACGLASWWQFATCSLNLRVDHGHDQAVSHAWSLCAEEDFYLLLPLSGCRLAHRPSTLTFVAVCTGAMALGIVPGCSRNLALPGRKTVPGIARAQIEADDPGPTPQSARSPPGSMRTVTGSTPR